MISKIITFIITLLFVQFCFAKQSFKTKKIEYEIVSDKGYEFIDILAKEESLFKGQKDMFPRENLKYWVRIKIPAYYFVEDEMVLFCHPSIENSLYYLNSHSQEVINLKSGFLLSNGNRHKGLKVKKTDSLMTIFVKMNLPYSASKQIKFTPDFSLESKQEIDTKEEILRLTWVIVMVIILIHFISILIDFLVFKEKTQLFYLIALIGGVFYVTSFHRFFNLLFDFRFAKFQFLSEKIYYSFELSDLLSHVGIAIITIACFFMTRNFLRLKRTLPKLDRFLHYYLLFCISINIITNAFLLFSPWIFIREFGLINNVLVVISFSILFVVGIISLVRKLPFSNLFFIANSIPFVGAIYTAIFVMQVSYDSYAMLYLPYLSIVCFTFTFSIALAFRNKNIQKELKIKEIETSILKIENEKNLTIQKSLREKEILLKEIHHRVKNNLQVISSLMGLQSASIDDQRVKKIFAESKNKIQAISLIHQTLYENKDLAEIDLNEYFKNMYQHILQLFGEDKRKIKFQLNTNNIKFDIDTSVPLALIFNELITNSLKYAFHNGYDGEIIVEVLKLKQGIYSLTIIDNGKGFESSEMRKNSLGLQLVKMLSTQLNGSFEMASQNGTKVSIIFEDTNQRKLSE